MLTRQRRRPERRVERLAPGNTPEAQVADPGLAVGLGRDERPQPQRHGLSIVHGIEHIPLTALMLDGADERVPDLLDVLVIARERDLIDLGPALGVGVLDREEEDRDPHIAGVGGELGDRPHPGDAERPPLAGEPSGADEVLLEDRGFDVHHSILCSPGSSAGS